MHTPLLLLLVLGLAGSLRVHAQDLASLYERLAGHVTDRQAHLIDLRQDIHRHPELSGEEERTSALVARELNRLGFEVRTGVGGHGVVGVLRGSRSGPTVAFRADMDAVRSLDEDPVAYRSLVPGVRHICGHDVHTAIGIGLAEGFAAIRAELPGTVVLLFQPAEERGTGANAMLEDGVFEALLPEAIFAVHTAPYAVGEVATVAGGMMTGRAQVSVTVRGTGDTTDAVRAVREALERVGTLPPERATQIAPAGFILVQLAPPGRATGTADAEVRGQIMTAGPDDRARAKAAVLEALEALDLPGVSLDIHYDERFLEGVTNDDALVAFANASIAALAPDVTIRSVPGAIPAFSEDFGSFQARVPGVMYFLGVSNPEAGTVGMPHTPGYVADDASILVGVRTMAAVMLRRLADGTGSR